LWALNVRCLASMVVGLDIESSTTADEVIVEALIVRIIVTIILLPIHAFATKTNHS
jgi:hypothetical protein